jgi:type I restriction enzyme S subunit
MSLPRYREYKESEASWLGRVPNGWKVSPLKHLAEFVNGCVFKPDSWSESGVPIIRIENLNGSLNFNFFDGEINERHHVSKGDLVFGWSGNRGTSFGPFKWKSAGLYFLNQHIFKVQPLGCNASWLYWCLRAVTAHVEDQATGIIGMVHVTKGDLGAIKVPVPSLSEQLDIAVFLDLETAKIDALITEQEKLIALLAEKRQATISHAITKGLDPNASMKDSHVAWMGEVPAHWEVVRIKRVISSIEQGWSPQCENFPITSPDEWGVLKVGCVNGGVFRPIENKKLPPELEPVPAYSLKRGDLLISRANTRELVGSAAAVETDFDNLMLCDKLYRLRLDKARCTPSYLAAYLGTPHARSQIELEATGASSSMLNIGQYAILDLPAPMPSVTEQNEIQEFLRAETGRLDALNAVAERAIILLKERRSALIAAAVTGQIDVRGAMPQAAIENLEAIAA